MQGLTLFVSRNLRPDDITHNGRFPTTTVPRTLLDLATRYDRRALLRALAGVVSGWGGVAGLGRVWLLRTASPRQMRAVAAQSRHKRG
jgi:hypothetical protein